MLVFTPITASIARFRAASGKQSVSFVGWCSYDQALTIPFAWSGDTTMRRSSAAAEDDKDKNSFSHMRRKMIKYSYED